MRKIFSITLLLLVVSAYTNGQDTIKLTIREYPKKVKFVTFQTMRLNFDSSVQRGLLGEDYTGYPVHKDDTLYVRKCTFKAGKIIEFNQLGQVTMGTTENNYLGLITKSTVPGKMKLIWFQPGFLDFEDGTDGTVFEGTLLHDEKFRNEETQKFEIYKAGTFMSLDEGGEMTLSPITTR